jgi:nucleotide-binding universal stress UspA family protein
MVKQESPQLIDRETHYANAPTYNEDVSIKKMLVPIDGSDYSKKSTVYAIRLIKASEASEKSSITFLHAISVPCYVDDYGGGVLLRQKYYEEAKQVSEKLIMESIQMAKDEGISHIYSDILYDVVSIPEAIVNYAAKINADLIVIGSSGVTGIKKFLLGSVASAVVSHAQCSVLVIK